MGIVLDYVLQKRISHTHKVENNALYLLKAGDTATGTILFPLTDPQGCALIGSINASTTCLINWTRVNKTGSNITDIATRNHNDLQNIQGGSAGDYQHLTTAQVSTLHSPVTVVDSATIDFTLTGQQITASVIQSMIEKWARVFTMMGA